MLVIRKAKQIFTSSDDYGILENGAIVVEGDRIRWIGPDDEIPVSLEKARVIDATDMVITPGFVDAHTHIPFYGHRADEFEMRNMGMSYMEIREKGGGIRRTVRMVRQATKEQLLEYNRKLVKKALEYGTTTLEGKSGYGLNLEDELKQLKVLKELNETEPIDIVPTFLGAHEIPEGKSADEYIEEVISWLPEVKRRNLAVFVDIFCEKGVFSVEHARKLLTKAKELGFKLKLHAEEFERIGGAMLGAELGAVSVDHLTAVNEEDMEALARSGTTAVLLPGTTFFLGKSDYAPGKEMLKRGVRVAIATDFNPGSSMTQNMQFMLTLAGIYMHFTVEEALKAATIGGAMALDLQDEVGSLEPGKKADILIFDVPDYRYLPYNYAVNNLRMVIKGGEPVISRIHGNR